MLTIVDEAYFENAIAVKCTQCNSEHQTSYLFFKDKKIIGICIMCGCNVDNEEYIMKQPVECNSCSKLITVEDVRKSNPCSCGEVTNKVVALTRYNSRDLTTK